MDTLSPNGSFILICPKCRLLAFDPKICVNCGAEIPSSTRIKILNKSNRVYEITGYHLNNFSKSSFAFFHGTLPSGFVSKAGTCHKLDTNLSWSHDENCACVKYLKTEDEVKKSSLIAGEDQVTEDITDEAHKQAAEELNSHSESASSNLVHPAAGSVTIYDEDMACLAEGEQLNDNIIDFYLNYIYYEIIPEEFQEQTHIFSSFFNKFLMTAFEQKSQSKNWLDIEKSVKKWVRNVDIFSKDFIFVPINRRKHWYLAVICFLTQMNESFYESKESPGKSNSDDSSDGRKKDHPYLKKGKPCICFFDSYDKSTSLRKDKTSFAETLKQFLKVLWSSKYPGEPYDWKNLLCLKAVCPQQENAVDCGLYLLQYVESFFKNPIPYFENRMPVLKNWFPKSIMNQKRKQIKKVVSELRVKRPKTVHSCGSDVVVLSPKEQLEEQLEEQ